MGRVMGVGACRTGTGLEYQVDFPNKQAAYIAEQYVYVRASGADADPIDTLVCKGHETPYFHERRGAFVRSLIEQRSASVGLSGLVSASIRLYRHQVEAVRRVLHDPVQRYLLADEVGLGKTIEAGIVLRQAFLDDPEARALVLVPTSLVSQWRTELRDKLRLPVSSERLVVGPYSSIDAYVDGSYAFVVIDEAHHVAAGARHPEGADLFEAVCSLAHRSAGLLLLSATPALHNEQDFLAMLHLLDPVTYGLGEVDAFRRMIEARQPIGQFLLALREGTPRVRVRRMLPRIRELFGQDDTIVGLCRQLEDCCEQDEYPADSADNLIRAIRVTVCETYRVHRRMLRTSRSQLSEAVLCERASDPRRVPIIAEYSTDERYAGVHDALEEWRVAAACDLQSVGESERPKAEHGLGLALQALAECSATWLPMLAAAAECRLGPDTVSTDHVELLGQGLVRALRAGPLFPGEEAILRAMCREAERETEGEDQVEILAQSIRNSRYRGPNRCAIFTSHSAVAKEIIARLAAEFGGDQVLTHLATDDPETARQSVHRFTTEEGPLCLVSDNTGEEGLNLQSADLLVHFDLPWDPNRLEQRIGRVDRIGRTSEVRARVLLGYDGDDSLHEAWYRVLRDGFRIFSASVADLQFYIDSAMPMLRREALYEGAQGLLQAIPDLQSGMATERQVLSEQSALDEIEAFDRDQSQDYERLVECDGRSQEHQEAFNSWVLGALNFRRTSWPAAHIEATDRTLLPRSVSSSLESPLGYYSTFCREMACSRQGLALMRIGELLVDSFAQQVVRDDRGRAFVLWRHVPSWSDLDEQAFFRLDFIVDTDPGPVGEVLRELSWPRSSLQALTRRSDAWFAPECRTVYIDQELRPVVRPDVLRLLGLSYADGKEAGTDYNIRASREWALEQVVAREHWAGLCRAVRAQAVACVEQDPCLVQRCRESARIASEEMVLRVAQLSHGTAIRMQGSRASRVEDSVGALAQEERVYRAVIEGIQRPRVKIDAVGVIVLSGRNPFFDEKGDR